MTLQIHEATSAAQELSVDTEEDLLLLNRALNTVIAEQRLSDNTDERKLRMAEALRTQVGDDMLSVVRGEHTGERKYAIEDKSFVLDAIEKAKQQEKAERAAQPAKQTTAYSESATPQPLVQASSQNRHTIPIVHTRITSYHDERLNEKPRRWFSR